MIHPIRPRHPEPDDQDLVRSILAGLPDPGPMPADLVERIGARLEAERRAGTGARVVGFPAPHRVPPSRRFVVGLAAAAAAVAGVGVIGVDVLRSGDTPPVVAALVAPLGRANASAAASGTSSGSGSSAPSAASGGTGTAMAATEPRIHLTGTRYTSAALARQAGVLRSTASPTAVPLTGGAVGVGPLASPAGVQACLDRLGLARADDVVVDLSTLDGRPAAVLLTSLDGRREARAVSRTCGGDDSRVLAGPVALP